MNLSFNLAVIYFLAPKDYEDIAKINGSRTLCTPCISGRLVNYVNLCQLMSINVNSCQFMSIHANHVICHWIFPEIQLCGGW
jgi:hypothetical protein